jgi:two-component system chemotaxis response regulator CheB
MIRVLVVEDSPVIREFLIYTLSDDKGIEVVGSAANGEEAIEAVSLYRPDVITMDIHMPKMDGFEATRRIMETQPTPIVIVSGSSTVKETSFAFRALEAGALIVVDRPKGIGHPDHEATARELVQTVKLMSEIKVIRRWNHPRRTSTIPAAPGKEVKRTPTEIKVVAIGGSTGAPVVLQTILTKLPREFPVPLLIVQHMATGFVQGFAEWLSDSSGFPVRIPANGEPIKPGIAYVAPDNLHMGVTYGDRIVLSQDEPENGLRPSVSYLFRSVAQSFDGSAIGVLLSGMGKDGAVEFKNLKDRGAMTIAQDENSSVVWGMPGEAARIGGACKVLPSSQIAPALISLLYFDSPEGN